jgi:hypothetical protein
VLAQRGELFVLREMPTAQEERIALVPEDLRGSVQTVMLYPLSQIGPAGLTAVACVMPFVVPPELEAAEGLATVVSDAQHAVTVEELFDVRSVVYGYLFHRLNPP